MGAGLGHTLTYHILVFQEKFGLIRLCCAWYCCWAEILILVVLALFCWFSADHKAFKPPPVCWQSSALLFVEWNLCVAITHNKQVRGHLWRISSLGMLTCQTSAPSQEFRVWNLTLILFISNLIFKGVIQLCMNLLRPTHRVRLGLCTDLMFVPINILINLSLRLLCLLWKLKRWYHAIGASLERIKYLSSLDLACCSDWLLWGRQGVLK